MRTDPTSDLAPVTTCLRRGEWVQVRSADEIIATLDENGSLDGLPFQPEMLRFCGRRMRVAASAHKTCDTITGQSRALRLERTVHLEAARCDGASHGGCQAACLFFWKDAWLRREGPAPFAPLWRLVAGGAAPPLPRRAPLIQQGDLTRLSIREPASPDHPVRYRCQATELLHASRPISPWSPRQYALDLLSRNVPIVRLVSASLLHVLSIFVLTGPGRKLKRRIYDAVARALGYPVWPFENGRLSGKATPVRKLDLKPGEHVVVRPHAAILETLAGRMNRGLGFAAEMVPYCEGKYVVRARVEKILDEKTGAMLEMKGECIALENVVCLSDCAGGRLFCPRAIYPYWREIWLERDQSAPPPAVGASVADERRA